MAVKRPKVDGVRFKALQNQAYNGKGLMQALASWAFAQYNTTYFAALWDMLTTLYGKPLNTLSVEEFLCDELMDAVTALTGPDMAEKIPEIITMRMEGQFSDSIYRCSYRSRKFGPYAVATINLLCEMIYAYCYPESIKERLYCAEADHGGYEYLLALEIRRGDEEIISLLHEAIMGTNAEIVLTGEMIRAVILSGHDGLLDDLIHLLLAAKLQEGLRQHILEAADRGSVDVMCRILKVCIDNNLFRFSSAIRAFDVWTGLGYGDNKPGNIQKYANLAYECLMDSAKRQEYLMSGSNTEAYFALWAEGCCEIHDAFQTVDMLLQDPLPYRRVLGWLFVSRTEDEKFKMQTASRYLEERDEETLAWITGNLARYWSRFSFNGRLSMHTVTSSDRNPAFPEDKADRKAVFYRLKALAAFIGSKKRTFSGNPFDFVSVTLDSERVYNCMIGLAGYDMDEELVEEILALAPNMNAGERQTVILSFLHPDIHAEHRVYLRNCLSDRTSAVKEIAVQKLSECRLTEQDLYALADSLRSKSSHLRAAVLAVFRKQSSDLLRPVLIKMLESLEESQNQAAIELLLERTDKEPELLMESCPALGALRERKLSTQTEILLDRLPTEEKTEDVFSVANGFGLYDPKAIEAYVNGLMTCGFDGAEALYSAQEMRALIPGWKTIDKLLAQLDDVFIRHADTEMEYDDFEGSRSKRLFGDFMLPMMLLSPDAPCRTLHDSGATLEMVPFWDEFREVFGEYTTNAKKLAGLLYVMSSCYEPALDNRWYDHTPWYRPIHELGLTAYYWEKCTAKYKRIHQMADMIRHLTKLFDPHEIFSEVFKFYRSMIAVMGEENLSRPYLQTKENDRFASFGGTFVHVGMDSRMVSAWREILHRLSMMKEDFYAWFTLEYRLEQRVGQAVDMCLQTEEYFRAFHEKIIPEDVLVAFLLDRRICMPEKIKVLTNPTRWPLGRKLYENYSFTREFVPKLLDRIVTVEEKRGELSTPLTSFCLAIKRFEGAVHFCRLLAALGKESFYRGYEYMQNDTKKAVLSQLLKRCYPAKDDTPQKLKMLLRATDISDKRLAEAVMYAPQWAGFAEEILGWPGLKCGVWFFHAHINELFSAEKETETALFSPISPLQFNDGAFDKNWFFEAYEQLGEKRFAVLYKSAKYITSGSNRHRRSQLYADAVLGKLDGEELVREISEKRNQEKLRCYPLLPIRDGDMNEALRRYEFIQKFLKESRQFGAQRRESEKKACDTAMENLAITTGLVDVNRLMWQMESRKIEQIRPLTEPVDIDGVSVRLAINESGDANIVMEKAGKTIKTVPKTLSKDEMFLERKETVKELKDLKQRAKESMERAMTERTWFESDELKTVCGNPVLAPMVQTLLWTDGEHIGFLRNGDALKLREGTAAVTKALRIAHPHDMKTAGIWSYYMQLLYEKGIKQPFKQVFREYYPITEDERQERTVSRRYAGYQVQPQRAAALLRRRGWTVDYDFGMQKVFYKENLIVRLFAMADWFSPADIEPPTLETVEFFDRKSGDHVALEDIPPILFSEVMRDLDLVVSVAYAGGVDPEASHSTVEIRLAIAAELAKLLKLQNISWIGAHAKIHGTLGNYSVHMGSGVVHAEGVGMLSILPVHSQARGRIFLPFADDDPKTAEIMTKILVLSEDSKLKDPGILRQLTR